MFGGQKHTATMTVRPRRSPFYTASPLGTSGKVAKNSFFRRLRSSSSDPSNDDFDQDNMDYGSKSTGWKQRHYKSEPAHKGQYGGSHLFLPFVLMGYQFRLTALSFAHRYLQVLFNVVIVAGILYFVAQFALTIRRDVDIKVEEQLSSTFGCEVCH